MTGIIINIDPIIFRLGDFALRWYSLAIITAIIVGTLITDRQARKRGLPPGEVFSLLPWVLIGGVVGARLFHVIDRWDYYSSNLMQILFFHQGGLAIWGGLAGGVVVAVIYARARRISISRLTDAAIPGLLVAQIIGRFGCIINGDAYGGITDLPWGFIYVHPDAMIPSNLFGVPTHPYPVYEQLWNIGVLIYIMRSKAIFARDGLLSLSYLVFYSVGRFVLTFVRQEKVWFWGLQEAQVVAILLFIVSVIAFIYVAKRDKAVHGLEVSTGE